MTLYRLSKAAEQDIEDLWVYIATQDPIAADREIGKLLDRLPMLAKFPNMGSDRDMLLPGMKSFPSKPYVIFYILRSTEIEILRIIHQSRNIEAEFSD
jgi:toxin ParE1/3/4